MAIKAHIASLKRRYNALCARTQDRARYVAVQHKLMTPSDQRALLRRVFDVLEGLATKRFIEREKAVVVDWSCKQSRLARSLRRW